MRTTFSRISLRIHRKNSWENLGTSANRSILLKTADVAVSKTRLPGPRPFGSVQRVRSAQQHRLLVQFVMIVVLPFCRIGAAQNCPTPCPSDTKCISGICQPRPSGGKSSGACTSGTECASGSCVDRVCSLVRSNPQKTCLTDKDCPSGPCRLDGAARRWRVSIAESYLLHSAARRTLTVYLEGSAF